jgi:hypothetical protein
LLDISSWCWKIWCFVSVGCFGDCGSSGKLLMVPFRKMREQRALYDLAP